MLKLPRPKLHQRAFKVKVLREVMLWTLILPVAFALTWFWMYKPTPVSATVTNNGAFFYGDDSATTQGALRIRTFTSPSTPNAEFNGATSSTQYILHTIAKTGTTREEMMIGTLKEDGDLYIETCTTGCDVNGDYTARWNNPGTTAAQDCDAITAFNQTCIRAFDIGYEALSGQAMVAYADNVADKFYYALWDGSAWSPDTSPGTPSVTNEVDFHTGGAGGTPRWIRVVPSGENLADDRADRIMVLIADSNSDLFACYWDGSSFSCGSALETALQNCTIAQCFDGAWQDNTTFVAVYYDTGASTMRYQRYVVGTGWSGGEQNGPALGSAGQWITAAADPTSSRILVSTSESGEDTRSTVWRDDDATDAWDLCNITPGTDCPDITIETVSGGQAATAFERFNGEGLHVYNNGVSVTTTRYNTYAPPITWGTGASAGITTGDDLEKVKAWGSPNSDDIMVATQDVDCDIDARLWTGAAWSTLMATIEASTSHYGDPSGTNSACTLAGPTTSPAGAAFNYDFSFKVYAPWQRNWRFYSGADTASVPTTGLAAENTAPTNFDRTAGKFRLRVNYAERGTLSSTDSRRKLQYTSGCNPNSVLETTCTWTDVDDNGGSGIWRYDQDADLACTPTDCDDTTLLTGVVLTGTNATCTAGNGCGTWVMDKDASAALTSMDHNGSIVQESEYVVEANSAAGSTTYYFRLYDVDQDTPVYREQDASDCGGGAAQCTYPSLTTDAPAGPSVSDVMRHGNWFSSGTEQGFFWAD
jgi:hypothetical protein